MSLNRKLMWEGKKYDSWAFMDHGMDYRRMLYIFSLASGASVKETAARFYVSPSRIYTVLREFKAALKKVKPVDKIRWN